MTQDIQGQEQWEQYNSDQALFAEGMAALETEERQTALLYHRAFVGALKMIQEHQRTRENGYKIPIRYIA